MSTKRLFLLRHADSPGMPGVKDMDRELSSLGVEQADALGEYMKEQNFVPDMVLCSSAHRTRVTLDRILRSIDIPEIKYLPILYAGTVGDYFAEVQSCDDRYQNILVVAHNPNIYALAAYLIGEDDGTLSMRLATKGYTPATLGVFDVLVDKWADIKPGRCPLLHIADPSDYCQ